jgi:hypothetical protein
MILFKNQSRVIIFFLDHIPGQGLGKWNQGTVEPIELPRKTNMRGLHSFSVNFFFFMLVFF